MATTARLGRELIAYALSPHAPSGPRSKQAASSSTPSIGGLTPLGHPNASAPVASLRGVAQRVSPSSWTCVPSKDASSTLVIHADAERPIIQAHLYKTASGSAVRSEASSQTCQLAARLHPPEVTPTVSISPSGSMLAAGSVSGRLYIWHLSSGQLLASFDAHFRSITCLEWTADERALVSASEDSRILVWSVFALMQSRSRVAQSISHANAATVPYAVLADHVQGITSIALSSSSSNRSTVSCFPTSLRIFSSSKDGSVKLWDVRKRSLVATWYFQGPVLRLAADVGFRAFYAVVKGRTENVANGQDDSDDVQSEETTSKQSSFSVKRVDLYGSNAQEPTTTTTSAAAMTQVEGSQVWQAAAGVAITSLCLSSAGSHLLVGTSDAHLTMLDVASSAVIRNLSLLPAGLGGKDGSAGMEVVGLTTMVLDDPESILQRSSASSSRSTAYNATWTVAEKLQRAPLATSSSSIALPIQLKQQPIAEMALAIAPPSLQRPNAAQASHSSMPSHDANDELLKAQQRVTELEHDNERLSGLLKRAQKAHATLWDRVVQDAAGGSAQST